VKLAEATVVVVTAVLAVVALGVVLAHLACSGAPYPEIRRFDASILDGGAR
jgi:hypothetical protein